MTSQEEFWDLWIENEKSPAKELLRKKQFAEDLISNKINKSLYRPAVNKNGEILGNEDSFILSFLLGDKDFFDVV